MLARCIGPRVLSAMLCVRFAQSMARHSTQVKQAFLYRVFWAVRWAMKPRGCSKSTTRAISSRRLTTHHISRSASTSMVSRFSTVWCTPKCGLARSLSSFCYRSMQRCAPTFRSIDLLLYERDTLDVRRVRRFDENDDYYRKLSNQWAEALRAAVASMDEYKD